LAAARVTFDPQRLNDCLNAVVAPDGTCAAVVSELPWEEVCGDKNFPWVGTVPTDGTCFFSFDCQGAPDSYCGADQKCHMKPTAGFPCSFGTCASAYYCGPNNTCAPRVAAGAPCIQDNQCQDELFCDRKGTTSTTDDVCAAPQPGGAPCSDNDGCSSDTCISGRCEGSTFDTCFTDLECSSHCAGSSQFCQTSGDCGPGFCMQSPGTSCVSDTDCSTLGPCTGYQRTCLPGDCVGDSVGLCTSAVLTADYCESYENIPLPSNP
jgi:hypothetical protein